MAARLHALILGAGRMGALHARRLAARPDLRVTVVDPALGRPMPAGLSPDLVLVATPTPTHATLALPWLERGLCVLVEKPIAPTAADAAALAGFAGLCPGHSERFHPAVRATAQVRPAFITGERLAPPPDRPAPVDVIADLLLHDLDLCAAWMGPAAGAPLAVGVGVLPGGALDIVQARVPYARGIATLTASRVSRARVRTLRLVEPGVYWSLDLLAGRVHRVDWGSGQLDPEPVPLPAGDALDAEHAAWIAAARGEAPFPIAPAEGLAAVALADAVRAAASGAVAGPSRDD